MSHTPARFVFSPNSVFPFSLIFRKSSVLSKKQHVIFNKTTRRFQQNNTSFSVKQAVVFNKTSRCFLQKRQKALQNKCNQHNNKELSRKCDTCDSKKHKIPVMCARTRTREKQISHPLTFPLSHFSPFPLPADFLRTAGSVPPTLHCYPQYIAKQ